MGLGKINTSIEIILIERTKDDEGFSRINDNILASIRAYKEERHASEKWANRALFSEASALFRFRKIPDVDITSKMAIDCSGDRYEIISIEDIKNRGMYIEVLAKKVVVSDG